MVICLVVCFIDRFVEYFVIVGGMGIKFLKERLLSSLSFCLIVLVLFKVNKEVVSFLEILIGRIEEEFVLFVILIFMLLVMIFLVILMVVWKLVV